MRIVGPSATISTMMTTIIFVEFDNGVDTDTDNDNEEDYCYYTYEERGSVTSVIPRATLVTFTHIARGAWKRICGGDYREWGSGKEGICRGDMSPEAEIAVDTAKMLEGILREFT